MIAVIAISHWGFAQESSISGPVKENYTRLAAKPGYESMSVLDVIEISDTIPDRTLSISMNQDPQLKYRPSQSKRVLSWETGEGKSYLIPALEIPGFILVLNAFDRLVFSNQEENGKKIYSSNFSTFWDHLVHGPWGYDNDTFPVNQVGHPYQGTIYYGFARSAGLNFWESLGYTFLGSFLWETGGETTHPSVNDQVASGIAGGFFGEALFRMASLLLEGGGGKPGLWRELRAAVISPPTGFNRLMEWLGQTFTQRMQAVHRLSPFSGSIGITSLPRNRRGSTTRFSGYDTVMGFLNIAENVIHRPLPR